MINPNKSPEGSPKQRSPAISNDAAKSSGNNNNAGSKSPKSPGQPGPGMKALGPSFVPCDKDVICARGKAAKDHPGNVWFRSLIEDHIQEYSECETKLEKSFVVSKVLKIVRKASPNGGFVKRYDGAYWEVGDRLSREKIGQTFRDHLHTQYRSSTKAKAKVRRRRSSAVEDGSPATAKEEVPETTATDLGDMERKPKARKLSKPQDANETPKETAKPEARLQFSPPLAAQSFSNDVAKEEIDEPSPVAKDLLALSNFTAPMSISGYEMPQHFPSLPNLNHGLEDSTWYQTNTVPIAHLSQRDNNPQHHHHSPLATEGLTLPQRRQAHQYRQQQYLAGAAAPIATTLQQIPGMDTLMFNEGTLSGDDGMEEEANNSLLMPQSTPFGSATIHEMFQAQLFSSEQTIDSSPEQQQHQSSLGDMPNEGDSKKGAN